MSRIERIGTYRLVELLAQRTTTDVHAAVCEGPAGYTQPVAVKSLRAALANSSAHVPAFLHEARAAAAVYHPNVVQAHGLLEERDRYFLVMELVRGWTVRALAATLALRRRAIAIDIAVTIVRDAAAGAHALHAAGLLHRNLSPENLMIGAGGHVKIIDFGCASWELTERVRPAPLPQLDAGCAAPEAALGLRGDRRGDVYSLGVVLHELVLGGPPPAAAGWPRWRGAGAPRQAPRSDVPPALAAVMDRALRYDRDERYDTAGELATALDEVALRQGWRTSPAALGAYLAQTFTGVVVHHGLPRPASTANMGTTRVRLRRDAR